MGQPAKSIRAWAQVFFVLHIIVGAIGIIIGLFCANAGIWIGTAIGVIVGLWIIISCLPFRAVVLGFADIVENQEEEMEGRHFGVRDSPRDDGSRRF